MVNYKKIFMILVCLMILSACSRPKSQIIDPKTSEELQKNPPSLEENLSPEKKISSEEEIRGYLVGEWISDQEVLSDYVLSSSDINCDMNIDEDLNVSLLFYNRYTNESRGDYRGQVILDRLHASPDEDPDIISIELVNSDYPGGDFFYKHRTIYDGKSVMSWFFAGNGNCIFDLLADIDNFQYAPEEIVFKKTTGEKLDFDTLKDSEFYAVFWGMGGDGKSLWLDEVKWTPTEEYDPNALYPGRMTLYEDNEPWSVLYSIAPEEISRILVECMYVPEVYYVKTDKEGKIIDFEDAANKDYIEIINGFDSSNEKDRAGEG